MQGPWAACWKEAPMHRTIESWLSEVSSHIKWRSAREPVLTELRQHLEDQREAFEREGVENAEELAVREMGDPCEVGGALNMVHKPHTRVGAMALVMALTAVSAFLQVIFGQREPMAALVMVLCCGVTLFIFGRFDHMVFGRGGIIYFYVLGAVCWF